MTMQPWDLGVIKHRVQSGQVGTTGGRIWLRAQKAEWDAAPTGGQAALGRAARAEAVRRRSARRTLARRNHVSALITYQPGSISNHRWASLADVGAAWWLLCRPSPAVTNASHCRLPAELSYGPAAEVVADGVHRGRAAEVEVDVDERGEQADLPAEDDDERRRCRAPSPSRAWS